MTTASLQNLMVTMDQMQTIVISLDVEEPEEASSRKINALRDAMKESMQSLGALKADIDSMKRKEMDSLCDRNEMALEMDTVQEQLALHIQHHHNDKKALLTAMDQIEALKKRNGALEQTMREQMEFNQPDHTKITKVPSESGDFKDREDRNSLLRSKEEMHCQVLALQEIIEKLRRNGVEIPPFPEILREETMTQTESGWESDGNEEKYNYRDSFHFDGEATGQRVHRDLEIENMMVQIKALRARNRKYSMERKRRGAKQAVHMAYCAAFVAGLVYRKPAPLTQKVLL